MNFFCNDMKTLQIETRAYHEAREILRTTLDKLLAKEPGACTEEEQEDLSLKTKAMSDIEDRILHLIQAKVTVKPICDGKGGYYLEVLDGREIHYTPMSDPKNPLAKFRCNLVGKLKGTTFEDYGTAEAEIKPAEYALFQSYIRGIGAQK